MFEIAILFVIGLCSFILGLYFTPIVIKLSYELHLFDLPDSRKVHQLPVPRTGGIVFFPVVAITVAISLIVLICFGHNKEQLSSGVTIAHFLAFLAGGMILFFSGLYDDIHGIGYRPKFIIQILAGTVLCLSGLWIATFGHIFNIDAVPGWIGMPLTVLIVVYVTNAMNLIDGIDGLASGLACVSFGLLTFLNLFCHNYVWAIMSVSFCGVILAFFYYNVIDKKNKVFMGDSGSYTLGFSLSFLLLHFWQRDSIADTTIENSGIIAVSSLIVPMFDVVRVFLSRIRDGRNPFLPDKNHIHHKLMRAGLSAHQTMLSILLLSVLFIFINWLVAKYVNISLVIFIDICLYILFHLIVNSFIGKKEKRDGTVWNRVLTK